MRKDFAVIIISHGRPECHTWQVMRECGYNGKMFVLIDDGDKTKDEYLARYKDCLRIFHKEVDFDIMDNFSGPNGIATFARNAVWKVARDEQLKYFLMLDDDLKSIRYRHPEEGRLIGSRIHNFDAVLIAMVEYMEVCGVDLMGFGGVSDYIGGLSSFVRKEGKPACYNAYLFRTDLFREFKGRYTEDLIMLHEAWRDGLKIVCFTPIQMVFDFWEPKKKEKNIQGGCQSAYQSNNGYVVRWYGVMVAPSYVKLKQGKSGDFASGADHSAYAPRIVSEKYRKKEGVFNGE